MNPLLKLFAKGKQKKVLKTNNAVIYTRVSSKEQFDTNQSLETQKRNCQEHARKKGLVVLGYFGGTYESAQTDGRKEFDRMLKFVQKNKPKISYIIVDILDRFSRTGEPAIYLTAQLKVKGVDVVAASQPIDTDTLSGEMFRNMCLLISKYDNDTRRIRAVNGMKDRLIRGEHIQTMPTGYRLVEGEDGKKHIEITPDGYKIRQAFMWKIQEGISNNAIVHRLQGLGMKMNKQLLTKIFSNPFYCGIMAHNLLEGEVVKGNHPAIISEAIFLKVNNIRQENHHIGYKQTKEQDELPLRNVVCCAECGTPLTGYLVKKKKLYYYKCNKIGCKVNVSAKELHEKFEALIAEYNLDWKLADRIKDWFIEIFEENQNETHDYRKVYQMRLAELKENIENVEERYALGKIEFDLYKKILAKYQSEYDKNAAELEAISMDLSNLKSKVERAIGFAQNISDTWAFGSINDKKMIVKTVFKQKLSYSKKNGEYRTPTVNQFFTKVSELSKSYKGPKNKTGGLKNPPVNSGAHGGTRTPTPFGTRS